MGKIITKNKIIAAAAIIMAASAGSAAVFQSRTANVALADDAITISEDIYRESGTGGFFDSAAVHQLYNALTKNENLDKDAEFSDVETMVKGGAKSVYDFGEIYLTFGGIRWTAVYLSQTRDSKIALTLLEADEGSTSNYWQTGYTSVTYTDVAVPANMYSTSYMRAVALNAGGEYATGQKTSASAEQKENNRYARFTMKNIPNSLTNYLFTPSQIDWQEKESARVISEKSVVYDRSNEAYGSVENTNFYKGTFGEGTTNYSNWKSSATTSGEGVTVTESTNGAWQNDYVWLPSATELGEKTNSADTTYDGKWHIKDSQRNFGGKEYWTRSAYHASPAMAVYFDWDGTSKSAPVKEMRNVRACIHLNLPQAEDESQVIVTTPQIFDENGVDTQRAGYNGASISQVLGGNAPSYTQSFTFGADSSRGEDSRFSDFKATDTTGKTVYYNPIIYNGTDRLFGVRAGEMAHVASFTLSAASEPGEEATYTRQGDGSYAAFEELSSIKYVNEVSNDRTNWNKSEWDSDGKNFVGYFTAKNADTYTVKFTLETDTEKVRYCWSSSYKHEDLTYTLQIGKRPLAIEVEDAESVYGEEVNLNQTKGEGWKVIGLDFAVSSEEEFVTLNTNARADSSYSPVGEYVIWGRFAYHIGTEGDELAALERAERNYTVAYRGAYNGGTGIGTDGTRYEQGGAGIYKIENAQIAFGKNTRLLSRDEDGAVFGLADDSTYKSKPAIAALKEDGEHLIWQFVTSYTTRAGESFSYMASLTDGVTNDADHDDLLYRGSISYGAISYEEVIEIRTGEEATTYLPASTASPGNEGVTFSAAGDFAVLVKVTAENHRDFYGIMLVRITSANLLIEWAKGLNLTYEYGHFGSTAALNGEKIIFEELSIPDAANLPDPDSDTLIKLLFNAEHITNIYKEAEDGTLTSVGSSEIESYLNEILGDEFRIVLTYHTAPDYKKSSQGYYTVKDGGYSLDIAWKTGEPDTRLLAFAGEDKQPISIININPFKLEPVWGETEFTYDGKEHTLTPQVKLGSEGGQKFFNDKVEFVTDKVSGTNVNEAYTVSITGLSGIDAQNYTYPKSDEKGCSETFSIIPKILLISVMPQTRPYDGTNSATHFKAENESDTDLSAYAFVGENGANGEKVTVKLKLCDGAENVIHAGSYCIAIDTWLVNGSEEGKNNYHIQMVNETDHDGVMAVESYTITQRSITISLQGDTKTYGDMHPLNDAKYWETGNSADAHGFNFVATDELLESDRTRVRVTLYYTVDGDANKHYIYGANDLFDKVGEYEIGVELRFWTGEGEPATGADSIENWTAANGSEDYILNPYYDHKKLVITPREATITVDEYTVTYGDVKSDTLTSVLEGAENEIVVFNGFLKGEEPTVTLSLSDANGKYSDADYLKAGEYSFTVAHSDNDNYTIAVVTNEKFVVNKLTLQLEVNTSGNSCKTTYGKEPDFAGVSATATGEKGFPVGEEPNFTFYLSAEQGGEKAEKLVITAENGGTYYLCAEIADNPNYIFTFSGEAVKWTITPKDITVQLGGGTSVYGEDPDFSGITKECTDLVEDDSVEDLGLTLSISEPKDGTYYNAGNYTLTGESTNPNYNVSFAGGNYEITKKPITVAATSFTLEYGNEPTEDNDKFTIQSGGLVSGDSREDLAITLSISKIKIDGEAPEPHWNVGEYAITGKSTSLNYEVTIDAGTLKITPRNIFIYIANAGTPYGADLISETNLEDYAKVMESSPLASWDINTSLRDLGITFRVAGTSGSYPVAVGTYAIEGKSVSQNYNVTFFGAHSDGKAGAYTVSVLTGVVIQLGSFSDVYGSSNPDLTNNKWWTKNGGKISYPAESGVTELDDKFLGIELEIVGAADPKEAGSYTIHVKSTNRNIICTSVDGTYTITPKPIKVTINSVSQVYGAEEVDLTEWSVSEETPLAYDEEKDVLGVTLTRDKGSIVGGYAIHGTATTKNYEITFNGANYTITPRPVTVTVKKATSAYGDPLTISDGYATPAQYEVEPKNEENNTGLVVGDSLRVQLRILNIETPIPGTYEIVAKGDNGNYTFTFKMQGGVETVNTEAEGGFYHFGGGKGYEVTKRELRLVITSTSSYYGEDQAELSVSIASGYSLAEADRGNESNLVNFFNLTLGVYGKDASSPTDAKELVAGVYEIKGTQPTEKLNTNADYYTLTFVPGVYTILQLDSVVVRLNSNALTAEYGNISADSKLSELTALAGAYKVTRDDNNSPWKVSAEGFDAFQSGFVAGWLENLLTVEFNGNDNADKQNAYDALLSFTLNLTVSISTDNWYGGKEGTYYLGVGNYAISGTVAEESIVVSVLPGTLRITPKKITVNTPSVGVDELLYYGDDDRAIPTASEEMVEGLLPGDYLNSKGGNIGLDIVFSRAAGTDAGDYAITGSYNANQLNYTVTFNEGTYKITPREVKVTITAQKQVYGDYTYSGGNSILTPVWSAPDLSAGDVFTMTFELTDAAESLSNSRYLDVGTYTIKFTFAPGETSKATNYKFTFTYNLGEESKDITIEEGALTGTVGTVAYGYEVTPRPITITFSNVVKYYGTVTAGADGVFDELNDTNKWLVTGLASDSDIDEIFGENAQVFSVEFGIGSGWVPAGTYDIKFEDKSGANYNVTFNAPDFIVEKTAVTFRIGTMPNKTYGEAAEALDDVWTEVKSSLNDGTGYKVADAPNAVEFRYNNNLFLTVTFPNDGFDFTDETALTNFIASLSPFSFYYTDADGREVLPERAQKIAAGQYGVRLREGENKNYTLSVQNGALLVNPKKVTVVIGEEDGIGLTAVYGTDKFAEKTTDIKYWHLEDGSALAFEDTKEGLQITLTRELGSDAKDYIVNGVCDNPNYTVTFKGNIYTITPKEIKVTIKNVSSTYGDTPELEYTLAEGQISEEEEEKLGITLHIDGSLNIYNHYNVIEGGYKITLSWTNGNYIINFTEGTLTVNPLNINATVNDVTVTYGDGLPTFDFTTPDSFSFPSGESADVLKLNVDYRVEGTINGRQHYDAGKYKITATNSNPNYNVTFTEDKGYLTVTARKITITIPDVSGVYGTAKAEDFLNANFTVSGTFATGEDAEKLGIKFTLTNAGDGDLLDAGKYGLEGSLTGTDGFKADNYEITFVGNYDGKKGLVTVSPKTVQVELKDITVLYGSTPADSVFGPKNVIAEGSMEGEYLKGLVSRDRDIWGSDTGIKFEFSVKTTSGLVKTTSGLANLDYGAYQLIATVLGDRKDNYNFVFSQANYFVCAVGLNVFLYNVDDDDNIYGTFNNDTFDVEYKNGAEKIDIIYFDPSDPDQSRLEGKIPDASEFTYSIADYKEGANLAVGRHSIVAAFTRTVNYNVTIIPGTYIVYPASIEVTIEFNEPNALARAASDKYSKVYDGKDVEQLADVTSNSEEIKIKDGEMVGEDVLTFTLTKAPGANAGDYVIVIALKTDPSNVLLASNYHITYGTGTYRILPRPVTVEIKDQDAQYGSVALNSDIDMWSVKKETEEGKGLADGEQDSVLGVRLSLYNKDEPVTDTALAGLTVGSYAIVGSSTNGNYEVTFTGSYDRSDEYRGKAGLFQVTGREVTIYAESGSSVYGEAVTLPSWHLGNESSVLSKDEEAFRSNLTVAIDSYTEGGKLSVNKYDVTVTYNKEQDVYANYSITVVNGTYTVTPRPVTVSVDSITETFGVKLDNVLGKVKSQVSGNVEGDVLEFTYSVLKDGQPYNGTTDPIPTGTYVLHAELAAESEELGKNYSINYSDGSLFIVNSNGIVVIVKSSVLTSVYGDALVDLDALNSDKTGYEVMGANGAELGSIKVTLSYVESVKQNIKNVGTYEGAVDAKVEGVGENVTIVKGTYTVTPKSITVTVNSEISQVYGEAGIILTDKWSVSSETPLAYEETQDVLGVTLTRAPGDAVGTYAISGAWDNDNYTVTFTKADYTITHRPITVRTKDASSTYGDPLAALTAEVLTGDGSLGLKDGEDISVLNLVLVLEIEGEWDTYLPYKEGGYQIICNTSGTVGNYYITVQNTGKYTVEKREVTLAANNTSGIYGTDTASIPFTYSITSGELAYGEQISVEFSLKDHVSEERLQVGNYIIECQINGITSSYSGYAPTLDNYEIKLENGEYEVTPRTASVVIYKQGYSYGEDAFDTAEGTAYTVSGLLDGDNLNLSFKRVDGENNEVQIFNVGTYRIIGDYDNDNYDVQFSEGVYEISKRILEVQIDNKSSIYGDLPATLTYRLNGSLVEGDSEQDLGIVLSLSGTSLPAGNYDITGTYNSDKYDVRFINGRYTVEKRTVEVQIEDKTSFYGEPLVPLTCILLGELPAGDEIDDLKIVLSLPEGALNAGSYLITGTSDNDNYTVVFHNGVYLISRASNRWDTRFSVSEWMEGDEVGDMVAPEAKYGDAIVRYFTDSACTQEYEGDIKDAKAGTYYAQVYVEDSENYSGLAPTVYEFHIKSMPSVGAFAVLSVVEVVAFAALLWVAVHFGKKKRK